MRQLEDREHMFDVAHQHWLENRKLDELIAQKKRENERQAVVDEIFQFWEQKNKEANSTIVLTFKWLIGVFVFYAFCDFIGK